MVLGKLLEKITEENQKKKTYAISLTEEIAEEVKGKVGKGNFSRVINLLLEKELTEEKEGKKS